MNKLILLAATISILFAGCSDRGNGSAGLTLRTTYVVPELKVPSTLNVSFGDGAGVWLRISDKSLYRYDFDKQKITDSIIKMPFRGESIDFYFLDSLLYVLPWGQNFISTFSKTGEPRDTFFTPAAAGMLYCFQPTFSVDRDKKVILQTMYGLPLPKHYKEVYSKPTHAEFHLRGDSAVMGRRFAYFPKIYTEKLYNEQFPVAARDDEGGMGYAYSTDPILYYFKNGKTSSEEIEGLPRNHYMPTPIDSLQYRSYNYKQLLQNERYFWMLYDKKTDLFLLFKDYAVDIKEDDLEMPEQSDKPFVVYLIDRAESRVVGKKEFPRMGELIRPGVSDGFLYLPRTNPNTKLLEIEAYAITK